MGKESKKITSEQLIKAIVEGIERRKGSHILDLDLTEVDGAESEHYIICHGTSNTNVVAIAESVEEVVKELYEEKAWHVDGYKNAEWILLDYGSVMVHVFQESERGHYRLESLWADATVKSISEE